MFNKQFLAIVLALVSIFTTQVAAQAQESLPVDIATQLAYLETYNISDLQFDPIWSWVTHSGQSFENLLCIQNYSYLTTYNIDGLENDPMWREGLVEFAIAGMVG